MRKCRECGLEKEEKYFCISKQLSRRNLCRECFVEYQHQWKNKNIDKEHIHRRTYRHKHAKKLNEYFKKWYLAHREVLLNKKKQWSKNNPHKIHAHWEVQYALARGDLIRPSICEICSSSEKTIAHHPDYNKPLYVIWVCKKCHMNIHAGNINIFKK